MNISAPFRMSIDGGLVAGNAHLSVVNPATEQVFATAPDCTSAQLDSAVAAARRAFPGWRSLDIEQRRALLQQMAPRIEANVQELAQLLTMEQGKPLAAAARELSTTLRFMRSQCMLNLPEMLDEDGPERRCVTRRVPIGVIAALAPWNYPVQLAWWKVIPALLTGNTVVLKPSPLTPLTVLRIGELFADLLPSGVLNVISGGDALGPMLTAHRGIDKVSFTGSTQTGKRVMASAAETLKRLTLELGGNDAAIVLPDVDVATVVPQLFWSAFTNSGQVCIATKRLYVHQAIYDAVADGLVSYARTVKVGNGLESDSQLGPIQNQLQYKRVQALVDASKRAGLKLIYEGTVPSGPGYFAPVTLFDDPPEDSRIVAEEAFGPVLPLLRFGNEDEAVERANATSYGLGGSIWSGDEQHALELAARLDTGTVWINEAIYLHPSAPFGGHKASGVGVEHGIDGLLACTHPQTLFVRKPPSKYRVVGPSVPS